MTHQKNSESRALYALMVVLLVCVLILGLISAFGSPWSQAQPADDYTSSELYSLQVQQIADLKQQVEDMQQQISELQTELDSTAVGVFDTPPSDTVVTATTIDLDAASREACIHYRDDPFFLADFSEGFVFGGAECTPGHFWGVLWPANDTYVITTPEGLNFDDGFASVGFDDNWYGIPASLRHPAYADALTLEELTQLPPGTIICRRTGNNPEHATEHVFFEASLVVYEYDGSLYPRWTDSQGMASSLSSWSLEDDGVIPYSNYTDTEWYGGWSGTRLTLGRCNAV